MEHAVKKIRILLADEQALFRETVRSILEAEPDLEIVAEVGDGMRAAAEAVRCHPDVALVSTDLPGGFGGLSAASLMVEQVPGCRVIVVAGSENLETLVEAMEAGASGYLAKSSGVAELVDAIRTVHSVGIRVPPPMLQPLIGDLLKRRRRQDEASLQMAGLTRREREVLPLLAQGADNDTIGRILLISPQTARTHIQNILGKLGLHSRLEAAVFATHAGTLDEDIDIRAPAGSGGRSS